VRRLLRLLAVLGALLVAAWLLADVLGGSDELALEAPRTAEERLDLGASGPSLGDLVVFSGPLVDGGEEAGRLDGECRVTSRPGDRDGERWRCAMTVTLGTRGGEDELQLAAVRRAAADEVRFSVTGGSGEYAGASGEALLDYGDRDRARIRIALDD